MAVEVKTSGDHPASMAERVVKRLRNSGAGANPNVTVQKGEGPTRTHTNIHHSGHYVQPNTAATPTSGFIDKKDESWRQK